MKNCDMCGEEIINKKCSCSDWTSKEENEYNPINLALEHFHEMKVFTATADMPHLGCALVFFRGGYNDCKKVVDYIHYMKGRPYYKEDQ